MGKIAICFLYITLLLTITVKYSFAFITIKAIQKELIVDQKEKGADSESSEAEKYSKDDVKKNQFTNDYTYYFFTRPSNRFAYLAHENSLPTIFQKIPKLPPKTC
jgi:hypothetical protein